MTKFQTIALELRRKGFQKLPEGVVPNCEFETLIRNEKKGYSLYFKFDIKGAIVRERNQVVTNKTDLLICEKIKFLNLPIGKQTMLSNDRIEYVNKDNREQDIVKNKIYKYQTKDSDILEIDYIYAA